MKKDCEEYTSRSSKRKAEKARKQQFNLIRFTGSTQLFSALVRLYVYFFGGSD